jgi:hypothetical protein
VTSLSAIESALARAVQGAAARGALTARELEVVCRVELAVLGFDMLSDRGKPIRTIGTTTVHAPSFRYSHSSDPSVSVYAFIRRAIPAILHADGSPNHENELGATLHLAAKGNPWYTRPRPERKT